MGLAALAAALFAGVIVVSGAPSAQAANNAIEIREAPTSAAAGAELTFTWEVTGTGDITHTGVRWSPFPADPTDYNTYIYGTPDFANLDPPDAAPHTYTVQLQAPIQLEWQAGGTMYYVVYAFVDGQLVYAPGGERTVAIEALPPIVVRTAPREAEAGESLTFSWDVTAAGRISRTALYWDTVPRNPSDVASYAHVATALTERDPPQVAPQTYTVTVAAPAAEAIYYVIAATVDGEQLVALRGEGTVRISAAAGGLSATPVFLAIVAGVAALVVVVGLLIRRQRQIARRVARLREGPKLGTARRGAGRRGS
jgi:hypothetical protein